MSVIAKELAILGNPIPDKMKVSTILHSLPDSWDSVVVALNYSATPVNMKNLPTLLGIEAERRNKKNTSKSLLTLLPLVNPQRMKLLKMTRKNFLKISKAKERISRTMIRTTGVRESVLSVEKLAIIKLIVVKIKIITNQIMKVPRI